MYGKVSRMLFLIMSLMSIESSAISSLILFASWALLVACIFLFSFTPNILIMFGIQLFRTFRTNAMCKTGIRMLTDIGVNLGPITFIITDLFAGSAHGEQTA